MKGQWCVVRCLTENIAKRGNDCEERDLGREWVGVGEKGWVEEYESNLKMIR